MRRLLVIFLAAGLLGCDDAESEQPPSETPQAEASPESENVEEHAPPRGPHDPAFAERTEADDAASYASARQRAASSGKQVLLIFIADWCPDCHEVVRVSRLGAAASAIEEKYEVVYMDVGGWDRHDRLRDDFGIQRIATLVVVDAEGGRVAQTTLEPISTHEALTPAALAAWLRSPQGA